MIPSAGSIQHFSQFQEPGPSSAQHHAPTGSHNARPALHQLVSFVPQLHKNVKNHGIQVRKVRKFVMRKCCFEFGNTRVDEKKSKRRNLSHLCNYFWNLIGPLHLSVYTSVSSKIAFLLPLHDFMIYCLVTDNHYQ